MWVWFYHIVRSLIPWLECGGGVLYGWVSWEPCEQKTYMNFYCESKQSIQQLLKSIKIHQITQVISGLTKVKVYQKNISYHLICIFKNFYLFIYLFLILRIYDYSAILCQHKYESCIFFANSQYAYHLFQHIENNIQKNFHSMLNKVLSVKYFLS